MWNPLRQYTQHYTTTLALSSSLLTLSSANYDESSSHLEKIFLADPPVPFDNQAFSQVQALDPFIRRFGDCNAKTGKCALKTDWLSMFNSLIYVGFATGILIGTWTQARWGRKLTVFLMSCIPFVSTTIIITSKGRWQLLAGRVIHYLYAGMELGCLPVYQAELVPQQVRGLAVGSYQMSYGLGNLLMNLVVKGTSSLSTDASWMIPFGLFYFVPLVVATGSFFIPESPRWLVQKGRVDEARAVLGRTRVDPTEESIDKEIRQIQLVLEAQNQKGGWVDMIKGNNLWRTTICLGTIFFNQATGQNFASMYGAIFIKSIGSVNVQTMGIVNALASIVSTGLAMLSTDHLGRRFIFCVGAAIQMVALFSMAGLGMVVPSTPAFGVAIVCMMTVYGLGYGYGSSSVNHVLIAEVPHHTLRDKTQRICGWMNNLIAFVVAYSLPYMLNQPGNLGPKVGFIFGPIAFLSLLWGIFAVPECKGRTLEEVNLLFYHKVPPWRSASWKAPGSNMEDLEDMTRHGSKSGRSHNIEDGRLVIDEKDVVSHLEEVPKAG